jgi:hypothetical protein
MPVTELAPVTFELEVEVDRARRRWSLWKLVATYRLLVLMTEGTIVCTRQEKSDVLRAYDVASWVRAGSTGPQPVRHNIGSPRPGVLSKGTNHDRQDGSEQPAPSSTITQPDTCRGARRLKRLNGSVLDKLISFRPSLRTCFAAFDAYRDGDADVSRLPLFAASADTRLSERRASSKPPSFVWPSTHPFSPRHEFAFVRGRRHRALLRQGGFGTVCGGWFHLSPRQ